MSMDQDLNIALKEFAKRGVLTSPATVISVDGDTVTVKDIDGMEIPDVRLGSVPGNSNFVVTPKVGSSVLISVIGTEDAGYFMVAAYSEIEKVHVKVNDSDIEVNENGLQVKVGSEDLKSILNDWIDEVSKIIVVQGTSINVPAMAGIKERINKVLA